MTQPSIIITIPPRVPSVSPVRSEGPVQRLRSGEAAKQSQSLIARMRRAFVHPSPVRLSEQGHDFVTCLLAVPGVLAAATVLALMLAPIFQGVPA